VSKGDLKSNKFIFDSECLLYGKLRPYLNKIAIPNFKGICSTDILPIKPLKDKANRIYLSYLLRNKYFVQFAKDRSVGANLPRLRNKKIINVQLKPNFKKEWIDILEKESTYTGNLTQSIIFNDGEIINRIVQVRVDDTHHDNIPIHINIDIYRTGTIKKETIDYKNKIKNHLTDFNMNRIEEVWVGIGYSGETVFQAIAFNSNQEQANSMKKYEEVFRKALINASKETNIEMEEL
jgi:hypothetical protein